MVEQYQIVAEIQAADDSEMLQDATWLKTNYAGQIHQAQGNGKTKKQNLILLVASFSDMVNAITALKTQFATRLTWKYDIRDRM